MNEKIRALQKQIEAERAYMASCNHDYADPTDNPETVREPYGYKMIKQGSDVWGEPEGYKDVEKPRWTKICKLCGEEKHTYEQEPVISGYVPKFS